MASYPTDPHHADRLINANMRKLARFMCQDKDLFVCRQFNWLHAYNICEMQDELACLEKRFCNASYDPEKHVSLITQMRELLSQYDSAIVAYTALNRLEPPANHLLKFLGTPQTNNFPQVSSALGLDRNLVSWYGKEKEVICLRAKSKGMLHKCIEKSAILRSYLTSSHTKDGEFDVILYREEPLYWIDIIVTSVVFCVLLLLPIVLLHYTSSYGAKCAIIMAFALGATGTSCILLTPENRAHLAMVGGFTAVLVLFLGSNPSL